MPNREGAPGGVGRSLSRRPAVAVVGAVAVVAVVGAVWASRRTDVGGAPATSTTAPEQAAGDADAIADGGSPAGPPDQPALDAIGLRLEPVAEVDNPTAVVQHPGTDDLFVSGVAGPIVRVPAGGGDQTTVVDLADQISNEGESGLLDLAFDAVGAVLYVSLVQSDGDLALLAVPSSTGDPDVAQARTLLEIPSPTSVHHAGDVDVDASGLLWWAVGDGGPSQEPTTRAQDLTVLRGKLLRIDPRPTAEAAYRVPPDNPFVDHPEARPEIWAYGLRNPWRFDLDPATGDLWIGDVGRNDAEEVNLLAGPEAGAGANLGWPHLEGTTPVLGGAPPEVVGPLIEYPHGDRCGVTGGGVYRGDAIPGLAGAYLYSDLCDGVVRAVSVSDGAVVAERAFDEAQAGYPVSFGVDGAGEMYLCSFDFDAVYRIDAA